MAAHIELPALDPSPSTPATFSQPILHDLLRQEMGFGGLVYTDSMSMDAVAQDGPARRGGGARVAAGADQILHSPDPIAAFDGVEGGGGERAHRRRAARRLGRRACCARRRRSACTCSARSISTPCRTRSAAVRIRRSRRRRSTRAITLVKDDRRQVPLAVPRDTPILYLSILDYPAGLADCGAEPHVHPRAEEALAAGDRDRSVGSHAEVGARSGPRRRAAATAPSSRRCSCALRLAAAVSISRRSWCACSEDLARATERTNTPLVTCFFGNPYTASFVPELPAMLLTYDFYDQPERAAVRALAGEAPIGGRLPITLSPQLRAGHGLDRP